MASPITDVGDSAVGDSPSSPVSDAVTPADTLPALDALDVAPRVDVAQLLDSSPDVAVLPDVPDSGFGLDAPDAGAAPLDADVAASPDVPDSGYGLDTPDSGAAPLDADVSTLDAPAVDADAGASDPCHACEPLSNGCADDSTLWTCWGTKDKATGELCYQRIYSSCGGDMPACMEMDGQAECVCPPTGSGETVCAPSGTSTSVFLETACGAYVSWMFRVENCGYPGCFQGACQASPPLPQTLWSLPTPVALRAVVALGPGHIVVAGDNGSRFEYQDGSWTDQRQLKIWEDYRFVTQAADGTLVAVGNRIWHKATGAAWAEAANVTTLYKDTNAGPYFPKSAWVFDKDHVVLPMSLGGLRMWKDGELSWVTTGFEDNVQHHLLSAWGRSPEDIWVVGDGGAALHYDGAHWNHVPGLSIKAGGSKVTLSSVRGTSAGDVFVMRGAELLQKKGSAWTVVFTAPEETSSHGIWVGSAEDIWVFGDYVLSHFDGKGWESYSTGFEATDASVEDLTCRAVDDCWAVGRMGLVMRFDGAQWEVVSKGTATIPYKATFRTTAVWGASSDVIFAAVSAFDHPTSTVADVAWVRRFLLDEAGVAQVDEWFVGPFAPIGPYVGVRGLWGTGADNIFVGTREPKHFDGESWSVLDLPPDLLEEYECLALTGRGDDLYVSIYRVEAPQQGPGDTLIAHRKASGGPWDFHPYGKFGAVDDLWVDDAGALYGVTKNEVVRFEADGSETLLMFLPSFAFTYPNRRLAVSHTGEVIVAGGAYPGYPYLLTADGDLQVITPKVGSLWVGAIVLPPSGPGFLIGDELVLMELGTTAAGGPLSAPVTFADYKPFATTFTRHIGMFATDDGDLIIGTADGGIARMAAPWAK